MEVKYMVLAFMVIVTIFISSLSLYISVYNSISTENNNLILRDFVYKIQVIDSKIIGVMNAHNRQVESWYTGNEKIQGVIRDFSSKMSDLSGNGTLSGFENCTQQYQEYYVIYEPSIDPNGDVDGYTTRFYDTETFAEIGRAEYRRESALFSIYECGYAFYDVEADTITGDGW